MLVDFDDNLNYSFYFFLNWFHPPKFQKKNKSFSFMAAFSFFWLISLSKNVWHYLFLDSILVPFFVRIILRNLSKKNTFCLYLRPFHPPKLQKNNKNFSVMAVFSFFWLISLSKNVWHYFFLDSILVPFFC